MNTGQLVVDIELPFLDLNTCARCQGTDANLAPGQDVRAGRLTEALRRFFSGTGNPTLTATLKEECP
jgi:hypothetical protein